MHDASIFDCPGSFSRPFRLWYRFLLPRLARRVRHIITVSDFSRRRLVRFLGVPADRISTIYNGIHHPTANFSKSHASVVERLDLPRSFLLFVGSLDPRKNLHRLVQAYEKLPVSAPPLLIAGGANPRLFSKSSAAATDSSLRVRFVGRVSNEELEALYASADAFVFPSLYEGFGLPPLEAMARGCPVLCSNATCLPEVCGPDFADGGAPIYFDAISVESIANAIQTFLRLSPAQRNQMRAAGRDQAARYSWDRCAAETWQILERHASP